MQPAESRRASIEKLTRLKRLARRPKKIPMFSGKYWREFARWPRNIWMIHENFKPL